MSELDDLVAVYGQIDEAVIEDPDLEPKVAAMLPPYRHGARGWYRVLQNWQGPDQQDRVLAQPNAVVSAVDNLRGLPAPDPDSPEAVATRQWLNGRILLASATLARIHRSADLPDGAHPRVLLTGLADSGNEQQLYSHLRRTSDYPNIESWPKMMEDGRDLVAPQYRAATYIPPIASDPGSFRVVPSRTKGASAALRTYHHVANLALADALKCLNPLDWTKYQPPWCRMVPLSHPGGPPGMQRYLEVISADCHANSSLATVLDFRETALPDGGKILEYRIPEFVPDGTGSDGLVSVDEGSLEVRPSTSTDGVHFVTTKRIQFETMRTMSNMSVAGLAFLVWVFGWDTLAERFIYRFASGPPTLAPPDPTDAVPEGAGSPQGPANNGGIAALLNLSISGVQNKVREGVGCVRTSMESAASGNYGPADYLSDLTKVSTEVTTNSTALASMWAQMWRAISESGGPEAGGQSDPPAGPPGGPPPKNPEPTAGSKQATSTGPVAPPEPAAPPETGGNATD